MDNKNGLTKAEVEQRINDGKTNHINSSKTKTIKEIFTSNILTYFNILNFLLYHNDMILIHHILYPLHYILVYHLVGSI